MFFERFFKPKWQHPKAHVRKHALLTLSPSQPAERDVLLKLAETDPDADVRRTAVKRVSDFIFLRSRAAEDPDAGVREVAGARYRQLLAGGTEDADMSVRVAELGLCGDELVLAHVARRGREPELRLAALERVTAPAVLEDAALNDTSPRVRQAAAMRVRQRESLERLLRHSRQHDRKVWRIARDALDVLEREAEAAGRDHEERERIVVAMEALAEADWREGYGAERQRLANRWQAVATPAESALALRFEAAFELCGERLDQESAQVQAPASEPDPVAELISSLQAQPEIDPARQAQLEEALVLARGESETLLREYAAVASRFLAEREGLQSALTDLRSGDDTATERLRQGLDDIGWTLSLPAPALLVEAQAELARRGDRKVKVEDRLRERRLAELEEVLQALDAALGAGHLRESQKLLSKAQKLCESLPERGRQERRLRSFQARLGELRDWRRFATLPKQAELCEQMEALIEAELPAPERAERIKTLQEAWKATGGSDSAEAQQLWERFRRAGELAFEPCKAYFDELNELRQRNLSERERITAQLQEFIAGADWERLELKPLELIRAQARREWRAAQPVERRANAPLQARFETLMEELSEHIRARQNANRERKQALVAAARSLIEVADLRAAMDRAKALQAEWRELGPAPAAAERRLWREFRAACDAVFQRRERQRELADQTQQENLARAEALCAELEALDAQDEERLRELEQAFEALGALPRESGRAVQRRFRSAREALLARHNQRLREAQRALEAAARARARLCAQLEASVLAGAQIDLDALAAEYAAVPEPSAELAVSLEQRWRRALDAVSGRHYSDDEREAAVRARRELCIRLEILAGLDSPEAELRMDLQVKRLAEGMNGQRWSPAEEAEALLGQWYGLGPAPDDGLEPRVEAALETLAARP